MPEKVPSQALGESSFLLEGVEGTLPILGNQVSGACLTTLEGSWQIYILGSLVRHLLQQDMCPKGV